MTSNADHSPTLEASRRVEDLRAPFPLSEEAQVPAGRYGFYSGRGQLRDALRLERTARPGGDRRAVL